MVLYTINSIDERRSIEYYVQFYVSFATKSHYWLLVFSKFSELVLGLPSKGIKEEN